MEKQQTAVELLSDLIIKALGDDIINSFSIEQTNKIHFAHKQAKKLEKNQIIDAWKDNRDMIYYNEDKDELSESTKIELAEQYYKEKYGDEN